jgi:4-aminobutyrate aminotransferase/diaminobutyrate-pyruvate transaminase/4-aminobutyrate aminotransferase/(S)-3-amino-2-methylpropionate transaminase
MATWELVPRDVPKVSTKYRKIVTSIPAPGTIPILETLRQYEPRSMGGQPPIVWDHAKGIAVFDKFGNQWLDWSSGVLVTNVGHCHPRVQKAILDQTNHGLLHNYCFPSEVRANLVKELADIAPAGLKKVFLLTTGAETTECAIKLARTQGQKIGGKKKIHIVTFLNAFHGRTLGAQMAGGIPSLKEWIVNLDPAIVNVPFPDGFRNPDTSFEGFLNALKKQEVASDQIAGVMSETYQGGNSSFMPVEYAQKLRRWCDEHKIVLIFDEVQAGFGRCGTMFGFEHYGVSPDLICCGKGITSGLPLSAVIGRNDIMDLYPPGSMTSTHTGNPVVAASAIANLQVIRDEKLVANAAKMGQIMQAEARRIGEKYPKNVGTVHGRGLVASMHMVKPGGTDADADTAFNIVRRCVEKGLMLFSPVGFGGASVKLSPPLIIQEEPLREGIKVLEEAFAEILGG